MPDDLSRVRWSQVRTGVYVLSGLAVLAALVFFLDVVLRQVAEGPRLTAVADAARDLEPGSEVWVAGVRGGRVTSISFHEPGGAGTRRVVIRAVLTEPAGGQIRRDAEASVRNFAPLEPSVLAIHPGAADAPYDFSDTLRARTLLTSDDVTRRARRLMEDLAALEPLARRLERRLEEGPGTLAALRRDRRLRAELRSSLSRLEAIRRRMEGGTLLRLLGDDELAARLGRIRERTAGWTAAAPGPSGEAGSGKDLVAEVAELTERLGRLEARLSEARGTAGRLLHDEALRRESALLRARVDSVRRRLVERPLRWLRFRLF